MPVPSVVCCGISYGSAEPLTFGESSVSLSYGIAILVSTNSARTPDPVLRNVVNLSSLVPERSHLADFRGKS